MAFAQHAQPLNLVRRSYGLPPLGPDLRNTYTWGDYTLYADIPEMVATRNLPSHHRYLGPVLWSTHTALPEWWNHLPEDKPVIFLTLGSSGQASLLPMALNALSRLPATVIVATAGKNAIADTPANAYVTDYLPMDIATRRSKLVISGVPVIGLCSNMDQLLSMEAVERAGAGVALRGAKISSADLFLTASVMLGNSPYAQAADQLSRLLQQYDAGQRLREVVTEILAKKRKQPSSG